MVGNQRTGQITAFTWAAAVIFLLILILNVPLFIRMPLATDVVLYDLQAQMVLNGGTMYQDMFETNLPGIVWVHMLVRSLVGMSSDAIRAVDLVIFSGTAFLLMLWNRRNHLSLSGMLWVGIALFSFYFSISEWSHFQRDTLILLPSMAALWLRRKQTDRLINRSQQVSFASIWGWAFLEGLFWAAAFWVKPFVAVPALCVWIGSQLMIRHFRRLMIDFSSLLLGGLFLGGIGIFWMWQNGAWPAFYETFTEWNPEYVAARKSGWESLRFVQFLYRFYPWFLLHLIAVPLALLALKTYWSNSRNSETDFPAEPGQRDSVLLAFMYLGWLFQSFAFQHLFDYVHPPSHLLAITVIGGYLGSRFQECSLSWGWKGGMAFFLMMVVLSCPAFKPERARLWKTCVMNSSNAHLKSKLALLVQVDWEDLEAVKQYLKTQDLKDEDLHCYNSTLVYLYPELSVKPATRFVFFDSVLIFCPNHRNELYAAVKESPQKFVVTDLIDSGFNRDSALAKSSSSEQLTPPQYPVSLKGAYPWSHPVVFRSGRYLVHKIERPMGKFMGSGKVPTEDRVQEFFKRQKKQNSEKPSS
ncbi:hypothetical protein [Gimesia fumaroli]|uniref:Glycosyltransferase RgtA/B/C/D-like domain-containing protein n=1 Tax=Gimesia fumaroli TaxID=2527976 RepID=A0A518IBR3_9PLAN|nr:hypothetical protein [Gimesia fumaroli]QDV50546.1 hypothetical protein Enr17x_25870 [Gimesia fumaroli]